jgi:hypothetical protein
VAAGGDNYVPCVALRTFWYNNKREGITHLKGVITVGFLEKGKKSIVGNLSKSSTVY